MSLHPVTVDASGFRQALAQFASGVTVVTTRGEKGEPLGLTVSAFCSVSLEPPLVLVSVDERSEAHAGFRASGLFGVSILAEDQRRLASIFADTGPLAQMHFPREGDPVLPDALASFTCRVTRRHPEGDHTLVIGAVERVATGADRRPLLYFRREYGIPR